MQYKLIKTICNRNNITEEFVSIIISYLISNEKIYFPIELILHINLIDEIDFIIFFEDDINGISCCYDSYCYSIIDCLIKNEHYYNTIHRLKNAMTKKDPDGLVNFIHQTIYNYYKKYLEIDE
jgi:hypothetical protein